MSDPINDIFNGTPDGIDEDELKEMQAADAQRVADADALKNETQEETKPEPAKADLAPEPKEENKPMPVEDILAGKGPVAPGEAVATGVIDWGVSLINNIPGVNLPKLPKYQDEVATAVRDISSVVIPTVALTTTGVGALSAAGKASKAKILADPFVKWLGTTSASAGIGAGVDFVAETNQTDDNVLGTLKQNFPKTYGWVPDDLATLDSDSPDQKRAKNVYEGIGLGFLTDVIGGAVKLAKGLAGSDSATRWIPESEKAKNWLKNNAPEATDTPEAVVEKGVAKRTEDLDNVGGYNFSKSQNLDEPIFGLHDMYGYEEMGIRSADDMGIVGASIDQVRIAKNIDTVYGRLGSVMTEPAMKFALEGAEEYEAVIKGLRETLVEADELGYRVKGRTITAKEVQDEGLRFAANLNQMDIDDMRRLLDANRPDKAGNTLNEVAAKGVRFAIKESMQELKASALVRGSLAGQVSDMAQGSRFAEGTATTVRSEEQIIDRLEFLMIQNGKDAYSKGRALSMLNMKPGATAPTAAQLDQQAADALTRIQADAKATADVLREIKETRPEMLDPLLLAYEHTDGRVGTIDALNNYFRQSTGVIKKALVDGQPDIPSVIMQGFWSNVYNSTLSAFATPIKAVVSAGALLIERPVATFAGALMHGDGYTLRRGLYQYSAFTEAMQRGMKYFGETMSRSAKDPTYAGVAGRDMLIRKNEQQIEILNAYADAKAQKGEYGPQVLMAQVEEIQALADHPWLRFGTRLMQATDGFTQTVVGVAEARGRAFDAINVGSVKPDDIQGAMEAAYKEMWGKDSKGRVIITDKAVKQASGEIAMNLDSKFTDGISSFLNRVPGLRPFLLFNKTPVNMLQLFGTHNPVGLFVNQLNAFSLPFEQMPINKVEELLSSRGIAMDEFAEQNYSAIRAELKGRKAIGALATMSAAGLFMNDRITGNGHYDRQKQRLRRDADWKPRSIKAPGGNWVSYDNLGPFGDWLALTADIMDNFDRLDEGSITQNLSAMGFILSASVTDKSMLAGIEPLYDMLSGNPAAINRWASSFLPSTVLRGSSQLAELTRLISPELRVVEENLFAMMANRTPFKGALPEQYDWIDGDKINEPGNFIARVYNTYSPWKVNGKISPEKQFLMDIEYDHRPSMLTDGQGLKLTLSEQADVYRLMGQSGSFKKAVQKIMQTVDGKKFREAYQNAVKNGEQPPRLQDYASIHLMLDRELNLAKEAAISEIDRLSGGALSDRRFEQEQNRRNDRLEEMLIPTR
jgi:hypothetical protein|tara:strand:+ start:9162 stop:12941 length:3780 start_codon:yes stop_codon:yes gene_type:complete